MAVTASTVVTAPVQQVVVTFTDEEFIRHVAHRAGATLESVDVDGDVTADFKVTTVRAMSADRLPEMARKFVGSSVRLTQVDSYSTPDADGLRIVSTEIKVAALPVSGTATQTLTPQGEHTEVHVDCVVEANIPFVGKKIAAAAEPFIGKALSLQSREASAWLARG
ncbi:hypothetical protein GCM10011374_02100 [Kocuria dechangensis]|jgi:hypothetical protein|uniref:DUF2505 domain-containing protein n=1 Tax=Kocuria dechangensis TaxID=1176249 RepID=A0A917GFQ4_9MICC|nr:DUF2505 domain-containing protein [Kocuria dechangensis]GGG43308.1 hypothetical protein GCM10011374_02100 [Kocuria dechangensis]